MSIRSISLVVAHELELEQLDVKISFVHGELLESMYMSRPKGFEVTSDIPLVCWLKRSLNGLKQEASRQKYKRF